MTEARLTAHLPGVTFDTLADDGATLAGGTVHHLSFDEWQALDPSFSDTRSPYERTRPVFWTAPISFDTPDIVTGAHAAACAAIHAVHRAFLIGPGQPWLPTPILSTNYVRIDLPTNDHETGGQTHTATLRFIGPMEREWLIFGSEIQVPYEPTQLAEVNHQWHLLQTTTDETEAQRTAWATLERTARPDSWWGSNWRKSVNDFLHCIASGESLLLDERSDGGKLDVFARRAAELDSTYGHKRADLRAYWSDIYRLRTALIHGRIGVDALSQEQSEMLSEPRRLLALIMQSSLNSRNIGS